MAYYMEKEESYSYESDWNQREDVELDMSTYDSGYVERWDDDGYSSSDFENEPDGVEPEPEPPDHDITLNN